MAVIDKYSEANNNEFNFMYVCKYIDWDACTIL